MDDNSQDNTPKNTDLDSEPITVSTNSPTQSSPATAPELDSKDGGMNSRPGGTISDFKPSPSVTNSFSSQDEDVTQQDAPEQPAGPVVVTHSHPKRKKMLIALLLLVLVAGAAAAIWYFAFNKDKQQAQATTTVKNVALLQYGSLEGPIGKSSVFPAAAPVSLQSNIDQQIFEGLVGYQDQKITPRLAVSWQNPDETTWIFTLRPNVTFQNGKKADAAAVKASFDALQKNEGWSQYVSTIKSVEAVDATHVKITTTQPDALLLNRLTNVFVYDTTDKAAIPSGTGAYTVDEAKSNDDTLVVLKPYDGYYQGKPKVRSLTFTVYGSDDDLITAAKKGKVDVLDESRDAKFTAALKSAGFSQFDTESPGSYSLLFNMLPDNASSPVNKLKVRQAIAYAIDRATFLKKTESLNEATRYMVPKSVLGYDSSAQLPAFDLTKAKSLQTEAGYTNGAPITFAYIKGLQTEVPVLIDQLTAAGFKVTPKVAASPDEMIDIIKSGKFDVLAFSTSSDYSDGGDYFTQTLSSTASNFPLYDIPEVDEMLQKSNEDFDTTERIKQIQEINRYAADNFLIVPVRNGVYSSFYRSNLTYTYDFNAVVPGTYFWNVGQKVTTVTKN